MFVVVLCLCLTTDKPRTQRETRQCPKPPRRRRDHRDGEANEGTSTATGKRLLTAAVPGCGGCVLPLGDRHVSPAIASPQTDVDSCVVSVLPRRHAIGLFLGDLTADDDDDDDAAGSDSGTGGGWAGSALGFSAAVCNEAVERRGFRGAGPPPAQTGVLLPVNETQKRPSRRKGKEGRKDACCTSRVVSRSGLLSLSW